MTLQSDPVRLVSFGIGDISTRELFVAVMMEVLKATKGHMPKSIVEYEVGIMYDRLKNNQLY